MCTHTYMYAGHVGGRVDDKYPFFSRNYSHFFPALMVVNGLDADGVRVSFRWPIWFCKLLEVRIFFLPFLFMIISLPVVSCFFFICISAAMRVGMTQIRRSAWREMRKREKRRRFPEGIGKSFFFIFFLWFTTSFRWFGSNRVKKEKTLINYSPKFITFPFPRWKWNGSTSRWISRPRLMNASLMNEWMSSAKIPPTCNCSARRQSWRQNFSS